MSITIFTTASEALEDLSTDTLPLLDDEPKAGVDGAGQ
jgi:hypothetical protein